MSIKAPLPKFAAAAAIMVILTLAPAVYPEETQVFDIRIGDTTAFPGQHNVPIPIYLSNYTDTVAGFSLWLRLSRSDIAEFQTSLDTIEYDVYWIYTDWSSTNPDVPVDSVVALPYWVCTAWDANLCIDSVSDLGYYKCLDYDNEICIDSTFVPWVEGVDAVYTVTCEINSANIELTGTLIENWELVTTRLLTVPGMDLIIMAKADMTTFPPDEYTPGIGYPQYGTIPLIKVLVDVLPIDNSIVDRTVRISIAHDILDYFSISDEKGQSLGVITEMVEKRRYYMCEEWLIPDEVCMYWEQVMESQCPPEGCDMIKIDTVMEGGLDVGRCCDPLTGSCVTDIEEWECPSQFDGTGVWYDGSVSVTDGSLYVRQMICGEVNGDGEINILDVVFLINFVYKDGPAPELFEAADVNSDGKINILDIICYINNLYKNTNCFNCTWPE